MALENSPQTLPDLQDRQLSAVVFVQDYLQLQFDGSTLTLTSWPVVHGDGEVAYGEARYRDALCGCIAKVVEVADVVERERFRVVFRDGSKLVISLRDADRLDPEGVRLDQEDGHWSVWQDGPYEPSEFTMMRRGTCYAAALEKYAVSPFSVYHPEVVQQFPELSNSEWRAYWGL